MAGNWPFFARNLPETSLILADNFISIRHLKIDFNLNLPSKVFLEDIFGSDVRFDLALNLIKEPMKRCPVLAIGATVDDEKQQEQVPVFNRFQQGMQSSFIDLVGILVVLPKRVWRVMVLHYIQ